MTVGTWAEDARTQIAALEHDCQMLSFELDAANERHESDQHEIESLRAALRRITGQPST
jgi:uncharacterized protein HemX